MGWSKKTVSDYQIVKAADESETMAQAAASLGLHFNTFARRAKALEVYEPNQGGKGTRKSGFPVTSLDDILAGKHPEYRTGHLKRRGLREGIFENKCDECGITDWNGKPLVCQLHHKNGDSTDHRRENLEMLCPNCHSQSKTYCGRNT